MAVAGAGDAMRVAICRGVVMALLAMAAAVVEASPVAAKERPIERDWRTGVTVPPGAATWMDENVEQKKAVIGETAASLSKACTHYAFLRWPPEAGTVDELRASTRPRYEAHGFVLAESAGANPGDTVWALTSAEREAVVLWGTVAGSAVYLSCLTAGEPASDPARALYLGIFSMLGLGSLLVGLLLRHRVRAMGKASLTWPRTTGEVKTSEVRSYRVRGGHQFMANVTYAYTVNGRRHDGDRLRFGAYPAAKSAAEADAAAYTPGAKVVVRYDPARPERATLEPGTAGSSVAGLILAIVGAVFLAIVALVALFA